MKELTIEQKAQRYDEALAKAKNIVNSINVGLIGKDSFEAVFPELMNTDNEKIKEAIIKGIIHAAEEGCFCADNYSVKECVAWLEKQGEYKPIDKVEPKFKIEKGKWYVCIKNLLDNYANKAFREGDTYLSSQDGSLIPSNSNVPFKVVCPDTYFREWTVQDANNGDVLVDEDNNIGIFQECEGICWHSYIYLGCDGKLRGFSIGGSHEQTDTHPATKEQRDTLEKAIADAGYEWNAEKKELKKIEQKPAWSEEDKKIIQDIINDIAIAQELVYCKSRCEDEITWLESLKGRYTWKPSDLPRWEKSTLPNDNTTGFNSDYFCYKGHCINYKELFEKLPKDD